jgi:hypothetical protein
MPFLSLFHIHIHSDRCRHWLIPQPQCTTSVRSVSCIERTWALHCHHMFHFELVLMRPLNCSCNGLTSRQSDAWERNWDIVHKYWFGQCVMKHSPLI